jgi:hypothetical protein
VIMEMIARTSRWVHPETFKALPVWCPDTARGRPRFDSRWNRGLKSKAGVPKTEANIRAANAFVTALGVGNPKPKNWTVCHIWGYDDETFAGRSNIVQDPRFYSCIGNMIWLPTPLKGFTDSVHAIKKCIRFCAFQLYGWVCEHNDLKNAVEDIRKGELPEGYPDSWPTPLRHAPPPGTAPFSPRVQAAIAKQKAKLRQQLKDESLKHYEHDAVREVLAFWKVNLDS